MTAYYNEHEPSAAAWLRELIKTGMIAPGEVDDRDIEEVQASDLEGFTQCHFFAGIGVWSYALRASGWPDDSPVWTGSCPCQPFSASGEGAGFSDKRHVWPAWFRLIRECRPSTIFGEQVASPAGLAWFDIVSSELEGTSYAIGAADICAAGVGAPHIRQRLWWVGERGGTLADTTDVRRSEHGQEQGRRGEGEKYATEHQGTNERATTGHAACVAHTSGRRREQRDESERSVQQPDEDGNLGRGLAQGEPIGTRLEGQLRHGDDGDEPGWLGKDETGSTAPTGSTRRVDNTIGDRRRTRRNNDRSNERLIVDAESLARGPLAHADGGEPSDGGLQHSRRHRQQQTDKGDRALADPKQDDRWSDEQKRREEGRTLDGRTSPPRDFWANIEWLYCKDGKYRPTKPGLFPLAHGIAGRVGLLRGAGNAIVAPCAQAFIEAYMSLDRPTSTQKEDR